MSGFPIVRCPVAAELLKRAFDEGAKACEDFGGFEFVITTRAGAVFEGAPDHFSADDVGHVLALLSGCFIAAHEIAAVEVRRLS